ncbi:MAG: glycosyltransferase [Candidatus Saccharimonadales bacterium]
MAERKLKVAIVCDWLLGTGGAERVVYELHKLYPQAPIYTSQYDDNPKTWYGYNWFDDADIRTTRLQKLPKSLKKFLPVLRALIFPRIDLSEYDLVISSSGAEAKSVHTGPDTLHICYCHSPTHYYWQRYDEYLKRPGFPIGTNWLARIGLRLLVTPLRVWDRHAAKQPDIMIANSTHIQESIKKYYRRDSTVIFPPVDIERFKVRGAEQDRHGFVVAGRQAPYKRIDLAVEAATKLKLPLVVIGNGPEHKNLEKIAGRNVTFLTSVSDEDMPKQFSSSLALIFPSNTEDFGITPIEAMAAGTPVIAYSKGGPRDYIVLNKTGLFFDRLTANSLAQTLERFNPSRFNSKEIAAFSENFSDAKFRSRIAKLIDKSIKDFTK